MIKIGTIYRGVNSKGKRCKKWYNYSHCKFDKDGWADPNEFLPDDGDLVWMKREGKRPVSGWIQGKTWIGFRLKAGDKVIGWKRNEDI